MTKFVNWSHWFALSNIAIAIVIASVYVFNSPAADTPLGILYTFSNWFSHIGFLTFFAFIIFVLPLCYFLPSKKPLIGLSSVLAAIGLALLAFDALLYTKYGIHLSVNSAAIIRHEAESAISSFGWRQWGFLFLLFCVWLSLQLTLANAIWSRLDRLKNKRIGQTSSFFLVGCFVTTHGLHVWADANLYHPIVKQDNMFPLSYPATAKTLMSNYGLLDIDNYKQQKSFQFDRIVSSIKYPRQPIYCSVAEGKKQALLILDSQNRLPDPHKLGLHYQTKHYHFTQDKPLAMSSLLYGLPDMYAPALTSEVPLTLELPSQLKVPVALYDENQSHDGLAKFQTNWQEFVELSQQETGSLLIGVVKPEQLSALLSPKFISSYDIFVTHLLGDDSSSMTSTLYTNKATHTPVSSHEDLAPTLLNNMGCDANTSYYSSGRNLMAPQRDWLISSNKNKLVLITEQQRIEVMSNGHYEIYPLQEGSQAAGELNTDLLSQGIKILTMFKGDA